MLKSKDILTDAKLLFIFAKVAGFISFRTEHAKKGEKRFVFEKFHFMFFLSLQTIIQIRVLFLFYDLCTSTYTQSSNNFLYLLKVIAEFSYNTFCLVICICNKMYAAEIQQFWQALYKVEKELKQFQITLNHTLIRQITHACVYCIMGISILSSVSYIMLDKKKNEFDTFYYITLRFCNYYKVITGGFFYCQQIVSFSIIKEIFEKLEIAVKENVLDRQHASCKNLLKIAKYHQKLCEIAKNCNNITAIPLVLQFVQLFCFLTVNSFNSTVALIKNVHLFVDIMRLTWNAIIFIVVTVTVVVSRSCMKKVSY